VLDGSASFTVAYKSCAMRLVVDRMRDPEATAMAGHLRERHAELRVSDAGALGDAFEHYRVTPGAGNREALTPTPQGNLLAYAAGLAASRWPVEPTRVEPFRLRHGSATNC
jgi:hypothetical protein